MACILIVDDSAMIRLQMAKVLRDGGHAILEAKNGEEGLALATTDATIDLIVTDLNMPTLDGLSMAAKIQELPQRQGTPVLMHTTETSQELVTRGEAAGVVFWVMKPLDGAKLLRMIDRVLTIRAEA